MSGRPMGQVYIHAEFDQFGRPDGVTIEDAGYHTVRLNQDECFEVGVALVEARAGKFHKEVSKDGNRSDSAEQFTDSEPTHFGDWPPIKREDLI